MLPVKPTDHTNGVLMNSRSDRYLFDVISRGGAAVGRSIYMPGWHESLTPEQIRAVIGYLRSLAVPHGD